MTMSKENKWKEGIFCEKENAVFRGTSFESVAYPGKYLVLKDGMLKLGTKEDKEEATFYIDKK